MNGARICLQITSIYKLEAKWNTGLEKCMRNMKKGSKIQFSNIRFNKMSNSLIQNHTQKTQETSGKGNELKAKKRCKTKTFVNYVINLPRHVEDYKCLCEFYDSFNVICIFRKRKIEFKVLLLLNYFLFSCIEKFSWLLTDKKCLVNCEKLFRIA